MKPDLIIDELKYYDFDKGMQENVEITDIVAKLEIKRSINYIL